MMQHFCHANDLQSLMDRFSLACKDFGLTISINKTKVLGQGSDTSPAITIDGQSIESVHNFVYLGSNICSSGSINSEIDRRIGKASGTFVRFVSKGLVQPQANCQNQSIRL